MASKRMLSRNISASRKVKQLSDKAALVYTWIIPYLDDVGLMEANPDVVRDNITPHRKGFTLSVIERCLNEMEDAGLITRYVAEDSCYLYFKNFEKFQTLRKDRSRVIEYPLPPIGVLPQDVDDEVRNAPLDDDDMTCHDKPGHVGPKVREGKGREVNLREKEVKEPPTSFSLSSNLQEAVKGSGVSGLTQEWAGEKLREGVPENFLIYAITESLSAENVGYAEKIIARGKTDGYQMNAFLDKKKPSFSGQFDQIQSIGTCSVCGKEDQVFKNYVEEPLDWICRGCYEKENT